MIMIGGSLVEFRLCYLWSLVQSSEVKITVFTVDET